MTVHDDICNNCGLPFKTGEERFRISGREGFMHESAFFCVRRLKKELDDATKMFQDALTPEEARAVSGIVANYICEMGSVFNDYDKIGDENKIRAKLGLRLIEEGEIQPPCHCHPMVMGTNSNCPRHGLAQNPGDFSIEGIPEFEEHTPRVSRDTDPALPGSEPKR